jgi:L-2,4-diaminobutyric acid acetyltransferase
VAQSPESQSDDTQPQISYRTPSLEDGAEIWKMVDEAAALDANSGYAYFMIARNFAATSVVAEVDGEVAGMVTAYPLPTDHTRLFVWQVNVRDDFQGLGIARGMLQEILSREDCANVRYIETTIAPDNAASEALFRRVAGDFLCGIEESEVYKDELFPDAEHQIERLFVIGPITRIDNEIQVRWDAEAEGYRLYAVYQGSSEQPAFAPFNPAFSNLDDALQAADEVREGHAAKEVVILDSQRESKPH